MRAKNGLLLYLIAQMRPLNGRYIMTEEHKKMDWSRRAAKKYKGTPSGLRKDIQEKRAVTDVTMIFENYFLFYVLQK